MLDSASANHSTEHAAATSSAPPKGEGVGESLQRLTIAVETASQALVVREQRKLLSKREFFRELDAAISKFAEGTESGTDKATQALRKAFELGTSSRLMTRQMRGIPSVMIETWDGFTRHCSERAAVVEGFFSALEKFKDPEVRAKILAALSEEQTSDAVTQNVRFLEQEFDGLKRMYETIRAEINSFPKWCIELGQNVRNFDQDVRKRIGVEDEGDEDDAPKKSGKDMSIFDLFRKSSEPPKIDVPIYRDNPHLTVLLAELTDRIPDKNLRDKDVKNAEAEKNRFEEELSAVADKGILEWARTQQMYMRMSRIVENVHAALVAAAAAAKEAGIAEIMTRNPDSPGSRYDLVMEKARSSAAGRQEGEEAFASFDSTQVRQYLFDFKPYRKPEAAVDKDTEEQKGGSDREQKYLDIFRKLDALLSRIAYQKPEKGEVSEKIAELIELKQQLGKAEEKRSSARLSRDKKLNNYAFEPRQGNLGVLALHRVPTENVRYDDVIGKSWKDVLGMLEPLIRHSDLGYLYSSGSMRGRQNNNMMIVGPYGCGKNMFLRALMADPRIIAVKVTIDRLESVWHGQSERNTRSVFELTHQKRIDLDKPGVVSWDEFDALYGSRGSTGLSSSIREQMQKVLQSVLDGDTVYEGVNLITMTNRPSVIPPAMFRRFANVVVIRPLDPQERGQLLRTMIAGIPRPEKFEEQVNWEELIEATDFAAGDLLGKIYDRAFLVYLKKMEAANPDAPQEANAQFKELALSGKPIGVKDRLEVFQRCGRGVELSAEEYVAAARELLDRPEIKHAMEQARDFYDLVDQRLAEAFNVVE